MTPPPISAAPPDEVDAGAALGEAENRPAGVDTARAPRLIPVQGVMARRPVAEDAPRVPQTGPQAAPPPGVASGREARLVEVLRGAAQVAAVVVLAGGVTVLLGWWLDLRSMQAVGPVDVVMNPLAALLFVLTGTALLVGERNGSPMAARLWTTASGLLIALCGGLVLMRSVMGIDVGVDEILFRQKVLSVDPPDWMAANTAMNFLLLGLALSLRPVRARGGWRPAHWLIVPAALMALLVVIGYVYGAAGFITFQLQLPMALNTALFFLAACFALVAADPDEGVMSLFVSDSAGGALTRRLLPALLLVPLVMGALVNLGMHAGWYGPTVALAQFTLGTIVLSVLLIIKTAGALHRSDLALRRSEEHFRALVENASDYVMILDREGAIQYVSPSVERILGYRPEEVLGDKPERHIHPDDLAQLQSALDQVFSHPGEVFRAEFRIRHRDGSLRVFENVARTLHADSGDAGAVANARDITDRRRAEDEIERQKAYFERILDSLDAGLVVFDPQGRFEYVSASAIRDPRIREWVIGRTQDEYGRAANLPPEVIEVRRRSMERAISTRSPDHFEQEARRPDGTPVQMLRRIVPLTNESGELERLVAFSVDITDRKAAEVALEEAKEEAERANRAKSEFLSRMSHELRTPMNAILGFAQLLARKGVSPEQEKHLAHILKGGKHLLGLINEVLDLARIESGRLGLSLEPIALNEVVHEAMEMIRPLADELGIELKFDETLGPEVFASADRQRLSQVLINLLSNAIKYNRPGGQVRIRAERSEEGVSVRVRDNGRGIPEGRLDQLFTPFARLGAEQTETEGTGLGLALSRRLAEAMGGRLELEETGTEGSTFRLDLRGAADRVLPQFVVAGQGTGAADDAGSAGTILYIEDNLMNLNLVEAVLESKAGWKTISALRGEAGIELARQKKPDLILLDLHLPDMTGSQVVDRLRADPATAEIPVVVISADATDLSQNRLRSAGVDGYLTKPLDLDEFLAVVERLLAGRGAGI